MLICQLEVMLELFPLLIQQNNLCSWRILNLSSLAVFKFSLILVMKRPTCHKTAAFNIKGRSIVAIREFVNSVMGSFVCIWTSINDLDLSGNPSIEGSSNGIHCPP